MIDIVSETFVAGFMLGFVAGLIIVDLLWYIYWKHVIDPMLVQHFLKPMWQEKGGS